MAQPMTPGTGHFRAPDPNRHLDISTGNTATGDMATGAVAVIAGPAPAPGEIKDLLAERFTPGTDAAACVQRVALPAPGDDSELFRAIAHALERPLEPEFPLWECWIIEGLQDDRWAILIKVGPDSAQHLRPAHLLARLCDHDRDSYADSTAPVAISPAHSPGWADATWQAAARAVNGLSAAAGMLRPWPAAGPPPTVLRYQTVAVARAAVDHIARKFGAAADDVAVAAITEGFRTVLIERGEQPRAGSIRTLGTPLTELPVEHRDPLAQLYAVRDQGGPRSSGNSPIALCGRMIQALTRTSRQSVMTLATAPPGPRYQLRLMGRRLERLLPIPPTAPRHGTGVAVLSYGGELVFGITTDYDGDPNVVAAGIESGMARLTALSRDSVVPFDRRRRRRSLPNSAARWRPSQPSARVRH
ncbi:wax ester/triacylglycerol synthase domain-containing protein [Mycobacterium paragordonae]|uniref:wax ester/triacylglycerol synthase domain-containing protein n=1 Tax=Mycobacterium paragordonae TaxID=1389713 RepID=UPI00197F57DE|nr:wax ester/triacylglycerol synthase domain-containing protein [Mycobacterium paragordonae]